MLLSSSAATAAAAATAAFIGSGGATPTSVGGAVPTAWWVSTQQQQQLNRQSQLHNSWCAVSSTSRLATATGGWDSSAAPLRGRRGWDAMMGAPDKEEVLLRAASPVRGMSEKPQARWQGEGPDAREEEGQDRAGNAGSSWMEALRLEKGALRRNHRFEVTIRKPLGIFMSEGEADVGAPTISEVRLGSNADKAGLRVGDRIVAASATVGNKLWTKTTLVGVESAINSRFRFSDDITFCVERTLAQDAGDDSIASRQVEVFEVELERPVPLELMQENAEGGVFVRRVLKADCEALRRIQPYDRVVAVSASLGDRMWRTNSLDGVLSALCTRIGSKVRLQFERSPEVARLIARGAGNPGVGVADLVPPPTLPPRPSMAAASLLSPPSTADLVAKGEMLLMGEPRVHAVLSQMAGALRARDPDLAISIFKLAVERGLTPDAHCCSSLIKAYGMKKQADKALEVVRMMLELGVAPDLVTLNAAMDACEKGKRPEEVLRLFREEVPRHGLVPDIFSYTVLVNMYGKRGELAEALALFEEAVACGLEPELPAYTAIIKAAVKKDDMGTALALLRRVFDSGLSPDARLYNTLLWGHTKRLEWSKAMQILRLMEAKGLVPDRLTYSYLLSCLVDCNQLEVAQSLWREMRDKGHVKPNLELYSLAVDMFAKAGDTTQAVTIFKEMRRNRVQPNLVTYTALMEAFVRAGYPMAALSISDEMRRKPGLARDVTSCVWRLKCFVELGDLEGIENLIQEMQDSGIHLNVVVYNQYLRGAMRSGRYELALQILSALFEKRLLPNLETHQCLLEMPTPSTGGAVSGLAHGDGVESQMEEAREQLVMFYHAALKLLAEQKVRARVNLYVACLHACLRTDRLDLAAEVMALRRANTLQIFQLFKKHEEKVHRWERKIDRELDARFYSNKNLV